ncbi:hypothetical protein [Thalassomonas haliotis]|uniref:Uncharacterized protein n=1 Tax=Thalassomonas haliotis TaxID=485448 RepID=A0ABY7VKY3_9GAMM|nr:hypothetical protein [Thalassomonas haliotis]WDE14175.1 hypothetical protein H3N35_12625 [Thalassomonas haliotis]
MNKKLMNKKLMLALMGMGIGLATTASAATSSECRQAYGMSNYYCNYLMDDDMCRHWVRIVRECGQELMI